MGVTGGGAVGGGVGIAGVGGGLATTGVCTAGTGVCALEVTGVCRLTARLCACACENPRASELLIRAIRMPPTRATCTSPSRWAFGVRPSNFDP